MTNDEKKDKIKLILNDLSNEKITNSKATALLEALSEQENEEDNEASYEETSY